jgi:Taurine catabolism dioxygenase TauD, TfdA family
MEKPDSTSLPPEQHLASTWYGPDMVKREGEWIKKLTPTEVVELEKAAEPLLASQQNIGALTAKDFPLPTLRTKLIALREELIHGRGFALLRGLPAAKYSEREAGTIFYGLGCHLGTPRSQNAMGHMLGHVRDLGMKSSDPNTRIYQTNERQTFHTDSADVVGLLCLKTAKVGGASLLVSASTIFNEIRKQRPDLLELLLQPIATDRRGEVPEGMLPYLLIPVFSFDKGYLTIFYQRQYIDSAQRFDDAPRLTPMHVEALNMFDRLANDPRLALPMELEPGDMQFVYNHALLHDRTGFQDWDDPAQKRHLLRLWLSIPGDRPLPEIFASRFGTVEIGNRGGIIVRGTTLTIPWTT